MVLICFRTLYSFDGNLQSARIIRTLVTSGTDEKVFFDPFDMFAAGFSVAVSGI